MAKKQKPQKAQPQPKSKASAKSSKNQKQNANVQQKSKQAKNTIADSIPYLHVFKNGMIEVSDGRYSKSYRLPEVNFRTATDDDQAKIAMAYSEFLSSFASGIDIEVTLYNKSVNIEEFQKQVFIPMKADNLNEYREEYNKMLLEKMSGAKNNLETEKILTISLDAPDQAAAADKFAQIDTTVESQITLMTKMAAVPMTLIERLDLLNVIYKQDDAKPLYEKRTIDGHISESFTLENCIRQGITTKDLIGPESMEFNSKEGKIGEYLVKTYYVSNYPTWIKGTILTDFASIPTNMLASVHFHPIDQSEAIKLIKRQGVNISSSLIEAQKKALKSGYDPSMVSPELLNASEEVKELLDSITRENSKLFTTNFVISIFAKSEEEMKGYEEQLKMIANKNLITVLPLSMQQEAAFATALPLANNQVYVERLMTSHTVSAIIPYDVKEIRQKGGMYYGQNASSKNMILYDRTTDLNPNGCILGMPGAGKSFSAKREMINVILNTEDEIYIIDPEREYKPIAEALGGSIIKIANGSSVFINPFDLNLENADDGGDPVKVKSDFVETICEIMVGGKFGLSPIEKSIIGRSVINIYEPYMQHLRRSGKSQDFKNAPTLNDFYNDLCMQPQVEAQNLALSLERFVKGALDIFSHITNVDITNRLTVYDIKDIGAGLKELGLQVALDNIWNHMIDNFKAGKRTWVYIDEFYLMMQKPSSAAYISQIWKRARKWNGVPTAITQNVEDMLKSEDARTIINNSPFVLMLGQSPLNKQQLSDMMNISPQEQKYISSAKPGMGLIRIGESMIPMDDTFPKNTKLYKIMTTKPDERL